MCIVAPIAAGVSAAASLANTGMNAAGVGAPSGKHGAQSSGEGNPFGGMPEPQQSPLASMPTEMPDGMQPDGPTGYSMPMDWGSMPWRK